MADSKITALTSIGASTDPANDPLVLVDVSDTSMAATGTTKKVTLNQLLGASGTATLASATITGAATVGTTLGVTGVSTFAAGTALLPALTTTGDTNTGIYYPAADTFAVTTGGSERYRVDSSGNVGVGVTPSAWGSNSKALQVGGGTASVSSTGAGATASRFAHGAYFDNTNWLYQYTGVGPALYQVTGANAGSTHAWYTSAGGTAGNTITDFATAKMTLDASGNLLVGTTNTNPAYNSVNGIALQPTFLSVSNTSGVAGAFNRNTDGIVLYFTRSGTAVGNVSVTTGGATFNSTSDYRLKESVSPLTGGLARVNALKPSVYKWKSNGSDGEGFLAHELAEVVPAAVNGEKDAVNEDGTIKAQSIDMSRIVPILVAAIKELTARVEALEA